MPNSYTNSRRVPAMSEIEREQLFNSPLNMTIHLSVSRLFLNGAECAVPLSRARLLTIKWERGTCCYHCRRPWFARDDSILAVTNSVAIIDVPIPLFEKIRHVGITTPFRHFCACVLSLR